MVLVLIAFLLLTMIFFPSVFITLLAGAALVALCVVYLVMESISRK